MLRKGGRGKGRNEGKSKQKRRLADRRDEVLVAGQEKVRKGEK